MVRSGAARRGCFTEDVGAAGPSAVLGPRCSRARPRLPRAPGGQSSGAPALSRTVPPSTRGPRPAGGASPQQRRRSHRREPCAWSSRLPTRPRGFARAGSRTHGGAVFSVLVPERLLLLPPRLSALMPSGLPLHPSASCVTVAVLSSELRLIASLGVFLRIES